MQLENIEEENLLLIFLELFFNYRNLEKGISLSNILKKLYKIFE